MIHYKDMTFCPYYKDCEDRCFRAYTKEVKDGAKQWWGDDGAPVCLFSEKPDCYKKLDKQEKDD